MTTLNERLTSWIEEYHSKEHSVIKTTPEARFKANLSCIRPAPKDLLSHFRFSEQRKVKRDRTFQLNSKIFEAPIALIDRTIELRFHPEEPDQVEIFYEGLSYGAATQNVGNHRWSQRFMAFKVPRIITLDLVWSRSDSVISVW